LTAIHDSIPERRAAGMMNSGLVGNPRAYPMGRQCRFGDIQSIWVELDIEIE
jgi:hypothetical protein